MRITSFLLAAVLLAACSNDAETTAPRVTAPASTATAISDLVNQGTSSARRAPVATTVLGGLAFLDDFTMPNAQSYAFCPAGSIVVGGGYIVESGVADLMITSNDVYANLAWRVDAWTTGSSRVRAVARCLQM